MSVSSQEITLEGNTVAYYCFWKRGLGFWHGDGLFSPGQNGKSDVFSETPIERIREGKREDQLEAKGGSFGDQGER